MDKVHSQDGTPIAFDCSGKGPAVILVCGGSVDHTSNAPLAALLAEHFSVFNYHRRGRGESGDTPPYAVAREVEDIEAVISAAGGSACLYGSSSGGVLALEAARQIGAHITKLALWEPPFFPEGYPRPPADTAKTYTELVAAGRPGDAVEQLEGQGGGYAAGIRGPGANGAVVAGAGGAGAHAGLRRHDHGRLCAADRARSCDHDPDIGD